MNTKAVRFHDNTHTSILSEVNILADAIKLTLGPKARYVALKRHLGISPIAKRGVAIAKEIESQDKLENRGAQIVKQVASKTAEIAGDGSTTATVLAQAIIQEGTKYLASGTNPHDLKRGIDTAVAAIVDTLKTISLPCITHKEITEVAAISANSDHAIGDIIAQALEKVGKGGAISVEDGNSFENELDIVQGIQFECTDINSNFVINHGKRKLILRDPLILLCSEKISTMQSLLPLLKDVNKTGKPLLIVTEELEGEALTTLLDNFTFAECKVAALKPANVGNFGMNTLDDIAVLTGTNVISNEIGHRLENLKITDLGRAREVVIDNEMTKIIDSAGEHEAIAAHVTKIRRQIENTTTDDDREKFEERLTRLSAGVAVIKVGAANEIEMKEKKNLVEDALRATLAAIEGGIVPGGGVALLRARAAIKGLKGDNSDQDAGIKIVMRALEEPLRAIASNAGDLPAVVVAKVYSGLDNFGYNAATGEYGDLVQMGVIDPTKVTQTALQNAASIASLAFTTNTINADALEEAETVTPMPAEFNY